MQIETKNLTHVFDKGQVTEHLAINNINTTITQGEYISVIGQTGSGKTTFIQHLNALVRPTDGEVIIADRAITNTKKKIKKVKEIRKQVGIVFQFAEYQLFEETVLKDISFGPITMGMTKEEAEVSAKKYIKLVGLDESYLSKSPFSLSGGEKRRVALAGILAMEPDVMIFDEPTAGLDPQGSIDTYKIFEKLHKKGKTIIVVTHDLDNALEHSQRTLMFKDAELVRDGKSIEVLYDKEFLDANELEVPKLVDLVHSLEAKGMKIGKVRSIDQLVRKINKGA